MEFVDFNNKPTKIVTEVELEAIFNKVRMNWIGWENVSVSDRNNFEAKTGIYFSRINDGNVRLHNFNYAW